MTIRVYHNPRCSKSRQTLALLEERGLEPEVVLYLEDPPSRDDLDELCRLLAIEPAELARTRDKVFRDLGLSIDEVGGRDAWLDLLVAHPALIERPIVVNGRRAAIGRPPERALEIL